MKNTDNMMALLTSLEGKQVQVQLPFAQLLVGKLTGAPPPVSVPAPPGSGDVPVQLEFAELLTIEVEASDGQRQYTLPMIFRARDVVWVSTGPKETVQRAVRPGLII